MRSAVRHRVARIRAWIDRLMWGGILISMTPWRAFFLTFVVFWLIFSMPYYSKTHPYEPVPFDPLRGLLGGTCFGLVMGFVALVFQDREPPESAGGPESPGTSDDGGSTPES
ncbi:MAG: hypothetical protein AB7K36_28465 [Chloroflexota bacterium]